MTRRILSSAAVLIVCMGVLAVAVAQTGGGYLGGGELGGGAVITDPGSGGGGGGGGGSGGGGGGGSGGPAPDCVGYDADGTAHTGPPSYSAVTGAITEEMDRRSAAGESRDVLAARPNPEAQGSWMRKDCGGYPAGYLWVPQGGNPAAVAPPPAPPTAAEVRDRTPLPSPIVGVGGAEGATGVSTLLWDGQGDAGRSVSMTIRGYAVTASASPQQWEWNMGGGGRNPYPVITASRPGSPSNPAGSYTYETTGDYTVSLTVTWGGTFTFSGNGQAPQTQSLGTTTQSTSRSYHVVEIRTVLESAAR